MSINHNLGLNKYLFPACNPNSVFEIQHKVYYAKIVSSCLAAIWYILEVYPIGSFNNRIMVGKLRGW